MMSLRIDNASSNYSSVMWRSHIAWVAISEQQLAAWSRQSANKNQSEHNSAKVHSNKRRHIKTGSCKETLRASQTRRGMHRRRILHTRLCNAPPAAERRFKPIRRTAMGRNQRAQSIGLLPRIRNNIHLMGQLGIPLPGERENRDTLFIKIHAGQQAYCPAWVYILPLKSYFIDNAISRQVLHKQQLFLLPACQCGSLKKQKNEAD